MQKTVKTYLSRFLNIWPADYRYLHRISIAHYIIASKAGLLYDSTDVKAFAKEAKRMLDDSYMRGSMSIAGKKSVERIWNWNEMAKLLLKAYAELEEA